MAAGRAAGSGRKPALDGLGCERKEAAGAGRLAGCGSLVVRAERMAALIIDGRVSSKENRRPPAMEKVPMIMMRIKPTMTATNIGMTVKRVSEDSRLPARD